MSNYYNWLENLLLKPCQQPATFPVSSFQYVAAYEGKWGFQLSHYSVVITQGFMMWVNLVMLLNQVQHFPKQL